MHVEKICGTTQCVPKTCNLRHPKVCSFYRDYKNCKFAGYCSFSHNIHNYLNDALEKDINDVNKKLDLLKEKEKEYKEQIINL